MSGFEDNTNNNCTLVESFGTYLLNLSLFLLNSLSLEPFKNLFRGLVSYPQDRHCLSSFYAWFYFDEFQKTLLKYFSLVLCLNICGIVLFWNIYGERIHDRFMRPASSKVIEDLKESVSKLKLPKEHSPRF